MSELTIETDLGYGIFGLTLNRAPVNALNVELLNAVGDALDRLAGSPDARALVISSAFKVFSAGLDLKQAQDFDVGQQRDIVDALNANFYRLFAFPKPVVAAARGSAIAGGLFFMLAADHAVAGEGARFGLAEVRVGASFPIGPLEIGRATLTPSALNRLMLSGQPVSAERAQAMGFVDEVVAGDDVADKALAAAMQLAASPGETYAAVKAQVRKPALDIIRAAIDGKSDPVRPGWFGSQTRDAMRAMLG